MLCKLGDVLLCFWDFKTSLADEIVGIILELEGIGFFLENCRSD